jgi:hypothetical protein
VNSEPCKINGCVGVVKANRLCHKHYFRQRRHGSTEAPLCPRERLLKEGKAYCKACDSTKDINEFSNDRHAFRRISRYCKSCNSKKGKRRYKNAPDKYRNYSLLKKFGITLLDYQLRLKQQNGGCAICGKSEKENRKMLAIDHDHSTNKIRGILCDSCNKGLGLLGDTPSRLESAWRYLNV